MQTVANKWDQRGNILSLSVPVAPTIILIGEVLYELDTTQSMHFFLQSTYGAITLQCLTLRSENGSMSMRVMLLWCPLYMSHDASFDVHPSFVER